ncbi:unnamed protein product [Alopecurus aequalis]
MAGGSDASLGWSDLTIDLLIHIFGLLELPEALAFRAVCPSWRSASTAAAGAPRTCRSPWLVSLAMDSPRGEEQRHMQLDPSVSSHFSSLLDAKTARVKAVALCGASHGWLIAANELSDLVLYDPFATTTIPLPPITTFFKCIEGVYGNDGNIEGYRHLFNDSINDVVSTGKNFYDKVVLSDSPSSSGAIVLLIHLEGKQLSFAKVGGRSWQQVFTIQTSSDSFADIVHHRGRFYAVTMKGMLVSLNYRGRHKPKRENIITEYDNNSSDVVTRYLVSTPWGHLLQVRVILDTAKENYIRVEIDRLDLKGRRMVGLTPTESLQGHAVFVGQNSPYVLSTDEFPELRPDCIYFTTPRLRNEVTYQSRYNRWSGVKVYDLKKQKLEAALPSGGGYYRQTLPLELWFTPS